MTIKPLNNHVLLELDEEAETITGTNFQVAHSEGKKTEAAAVKGNVLAIAPDTFTPKMVPDLSKDPPIKKGDKVLASKWDGKMAILEGKKYMLIEYQYILGVIK